LPFRNIKFNQINSTAVNMPSHKNNKISTDINVIKCYNNLKLNILI